MLHGSFRTAAQTWRGGCFAGVAVLRSCGAPVLRGCGVAGLRPGSSDLCTPIQTNPGEEPAQFLPISPFRNFLGEEPAEFLPSSHFRCPAFSGAGPLAHRRKSVFSYGTCAAISPYVLCDGAGHQHEIGPAPEGLGTCTGGSPRFCPRCMSGTLFCPTNTISNLRNSLINSQ